MGVCVYCMQEKPISAHKCPHCHERTGIVESTFWTAVQYILPRFMMVIAVFMLYQCTMNANAETIMPAATQQVYK